MSQKITEGEKQKATQSLPPAAGGRLAGDNTEARQPGLTPTEILILDLLASEPLDRETLFARAEPSIWGHHVTLAAVEAGYRADDDYRLMILGKQPAFDRALNSLCRQRFVRRERGGLLTVKGARRGVVVDADGQLVTYVPGSQARETTRWQIENNVRETLRAHPELLESLSPPMSEADFALLVESMRTEGFDPLLPITIDGNGNIVDGYQRLKAANAAGVSPRFRSVRFESNAERVRFIVRANLHRRNISPRQRAQAEKAVSQLGVSLDDVSGIIGHLTSKGRGSNVYGSNHHEADALRTAKHGAADGKISNRRSHGMSKQTRQRIVALLEGIRDQHPSSIKEMGEARQATARMVANRFGKSVGTILDPVVRKAGHSSVDKFDRLVLDWLEGDGSALLASILGLGNWDQDDVSVLRALLSESGRTDPGS